MDYNKVLGCLLGAAVGDAMGAATETRNREQIREYFGGYVREFLTPPDDTFAHGCRAGQVTDDFSIAYVSCQEMIREGGKASKEAGERALIAWFEVPEFSRFAGPTTKASVYRLLGKEMPLNGAEAFKPGIDNGKGTNGAGMKAAALALFSGGDVDRAIRDTLTVCRTTHDNNIALSGACAVAAATAVALQEGKSLADLIQAGIYGAEKGAELARQEGAAVICGPSIAKRIRKAAELGATAPDMETAMEWLGDLIGSGLMAAEAVPAAFGLVAASGGSAVEGIFGGVNIGDDTDTVATMVGGILGAYEGAEVFPKQYLTIIRDNNRIDIERLAAEIVESVKKEEGYV